MTISGLFGDQEICVVDYPSEEENSNVAYLLKLDGDVFSNIYTHENHTFVDEEYIVIEDGNVTGKELRKYLEDQVKIYLK